MTLISKHSHYFDSAFCENEQLPRLFTVLFQEIGNAENPKIRVSVNGNQAGDAIDDNSYSGDNYRYHDIFHYSFATLLGWSPCSRAMLKRKRKSNSLVDKVEDGARAIIAEEAISLLVFTEAKKNNFFEKRNKIDRHILKIIKQMTDGLEVSKRSMSDWERAILKSYEIFRLLIKNKGGKVIFNMDAMTVEYFKILA